MFARMLLLAGLAGLLAPAARADVTPHPLFSDNMVLQQGTKLPVWGVATPGEKVTVTVAGPSGSGEATVTADDKGMWKAELPALKAGVDNTLTIAGKNTVALKNVAVGEVWVCSGQSNMEMTINSSETPDKVKAVSANPRLRLFTVKKMTAAGPMTNLAKLQHFTKWDVAGPEHRLATSRPLATTSASTSRSILPGDVPVGLIHTSWGGTPAEAWTSTEALGGCAKPEVLQRATPGRRLHAEVIKAASRSTPWRHGMITRTRRRHTWRRIDEVEGGRGEGEGRRQAAGPEGPAEGPEEGRPGPETNSNSPGTGCTTP